MCIRDSPKSISSAKNINKLAPVSYTHLDVYKRQQWSFWGRNPDYLLHEFSEEELFFKNIKTNITAISCLLYTSRCV